MPEPHPAGSAPPVEGLSFEQALALYQRGAELKAHCEKRLSEARLKVERIVLGADGQPKGVEAADFG